MKNKFFHHTFNYEQITNPGVFSVIMFVYIKDFFWFLVFVCVVEQYTESK